VRGLLVTYLGRPVDAAINRTSGNSEYYAGPDMCVPSREECRL